MRFTRYFGTDGIRGRVGQFPIVPEFILKLGWATGRVFSRYGLRKIILGKDTRVSSHMLESALEAGLSSSGISSMYTGPIPTPAVSYFTRVFRAAAGIVISASHNPFYDNGVKFFFIDGIKLSIDIEKAIELELKTNSVHYVKSEKFGQSSWIVDAASRYIEFCKGTFPSYLSLKDLKIVVDCANGAAYNIAPNVLYELGANIICVGCHPNGLNINKECGATDIRRLRNTVLDEHANLGIAYDGDADRVIMVDHLGNKVDGDQMLYIIARDRQRYSQLLGGVVGTQMSNIGLKLSLKSLGIPFVRSYVGDRYVVNMLKKKGWYIGGESSGHIILLDKSVTGDGIIVSLQVLLAMVNNEVSLYDLCQGIHLLPQVLFNVPFIYSKSILLSNIVKETVRDAKKELGKKGRVLLRVSGTEPCIRVMVEGEYYDQVCNLANKIVNVVKTINCIVLINCLKYFLVSVYMCV